VSVKRLLPRVAGECWLVGGIAAAIVIPTLLAVGPSTAHGFYRTSDAPLFLADARNQFGNGTHFVGQALIQGVAYRYGRIGFPFVGWLLALGRPQAVPWTLAATYVAAIAAWVAFAGEHLRRGGRSPRLALLTFVTPWALLAFFVPCIVSEPMAGALVLLAYLYERDGRTRATRITAACAILTRELMLVAFLPIAWRDWRTRRWLAVRDWSLVVAPYALWTVWVRVRVGTFPFLDPASSRRDALALPLVGWLRTLNGPLDNDQGWAILFAFLTVGVAVAVVARGKWTYPVTHGAVALAALSLCYGISVFAFPGEAYRVMAPTQVLLLIAVCDRGQVRAVPAPRSPVLVEA
jgi:hypothetical protein